MSNTTVAEVQRTHRPGATVVRFGFLGFMLGGVNGTAIWLAGRGAPKWQLVVLVAVAVAASFLAERLSPYEPTWNGTGADTRRDVAHAVVNEGLQLGSLAMLPLLVATVGVRGAWPTALPFAVQVVGAVVLLDAAITLAHWWSHRWSPLWRVHAVHHSVERFYGLNGLMKHPLHQLFETALATAPLVLVGLPSDVASAAVVLVAVQLLVQHSNVDYATGSLHRIVAVNRIHRFHHLKWAGVGDVNFGLFLTVWDRLLGTYAWDPARRFDSDVLGIAAEADYPVAYRAQLLHPFRGAPRADGLPRTVARTST